ncbi:unnamed protein product [Zymoseptoria tritici ST99CH_1E4]|uniref:Uncharacterized protein n=1 Tax=Zymoseptoria tritici ST99CH_1E4 TaxID=1276532 RepID=A0A2H1FYY8_ZYMTR|nr:unnamed protein product [Zymoseptoria tritici ST99CH_1E4]
MTPSRLMRTLLPSRLRAATTANAATRSSAAVVLSPASSSSPQPCSDPRACLRNCRCYAQVQGLDPLNRNIWFSSAAPRSLSLQQSGEHGGDHKPPDERTLQLGKTVRLLHERLPTLLKEPLPSEILSPRISLHLFPSTHPHLPTVSGRLAYIAALWTAPVAWGRMPLVGNVNLTILSERMVRNGGTTVSADRRDEKLIVKWKTCGKTTHRDGTGGVYRGIGVAAKDPMDRIKDFIAGTKSKDTGGRDTEEFCGIFVFEFDEKGRIVKHVIEHTEEGSDCDKMTRVVSVTDWLLGRINGRRKEEEMSLAWCEERPSAGRISLMDRRK